MAADQIQGQWTSWPVAIHVKPAGRPRISPLFAHIQQREYHDDNALYTFLCSIKSQYPYQHSLCLLVLLFPRPAPLSRTPQSPLLLHILYTLLSQWAAPNPVTPLLSRALLTIPPADKSHTTKIHTTTGHKTIDTTPSAQGEMASACP